MSCHFRDGGEPLAGGLGLKTPFGVIYSANITSDRETGIGTWTSDQFYHAMHDGIDVQGENLYPAFPYPWFRRASREDDDAIFAYLKTTPAVNYTPPRIDLPFPLNYSVHGEGLGICCFSTPMISSPIPANRANGIAARISSMASATAAACHTPITRSAPTNPEQDLYGGDLDNWVAPDLTSNERTGFGGWSIDDIAEFLRNGRNAHAGGGRPHGRCRHLFHLTDER